MIWSPPMTSKLMDIIPRELGIIVSLTEGMGSGDGTVICFVRCIYSTARRGGGKVLLCKVVL